MVQLISISSATHVGKSCTARTLQKNYQNFRGTLVILVCAVLDIDSNPKVGVYGFRSPGDLRAAALQFDHLCHAKVNGVSKGPLADLRLKKV